MFLFHKLLFLHYLASVFISLSSAYKKDGKCYKSMNLVIALDASGSIEPATWQSEIQLAKEIVQNNTDEKSGNKFAIIDFSTKASVRLNLDADSSKAIATLNALKENFKDGHSYLDSALNEASKIFQSKTSNEDIDVFLIVTDGYMTFRNGKENEFYLQSPRDKLRAANVVSFSVGTGKYRKYSILKFIANDLDTSHVFMIEDSAKLITEIQKTAEKPCKDERNEINIACGAKKIKRLGQGCYRDNLIQPRPLPELIFTDRDTSVSVYSGIKINWKDWDNYLPNLVCRCAVESDKKGNKLFGLQYYGECWSSDKTNTYDKDGAAESDTKCKTLAYKPCNSTSIYCVGDQNYNFVYSIL